MKRHITAYELVQAYRDQYATLPTTGVELQELRYYADAHGYDALQEQGQEISSDVSTVSVCNQVKDDE